MSSPNLSMSELLARSFTETTYFKKGCIVIPPSILDILGTALQIDYVNSNGRYLIVARLGDTYFPGKPAEYTDDGLALSCKAIEGMTLQNGDEVDLWYSAVGEYFTVRKTYRI